MSTRRPFDHLGSCKFLIEIEGVTQAAFTAVEGMEAHTEVVTFVDGSDPTVRKRPGRTSYSNLVLKRGFVNSEQLWKWYKAVIDGKVERKAGSLIILDESMNEVLRYNFFEAWPCRWKSFVMDASTTGTLVEEVEIVIERIEKG